MLTTTRNHGLTTTWEQTNALHHIHGTNSGRTCARLFGLQKISKNVLRVESPVYSLLKLHEWGLTVLNFLPNFVSISVNVSEKSVFDKQTDCEPVLIMFCLGQNLKQEKLPVLTFPYLHGNNNIYLRSEFQNSGNKFK